MELRGLSVKLKPKQEEAVKHILQGRDVICNLPVGYGKSMIFHVLPGTDYDIELLKQEKSAFKVLAVCPLTALVEDQLERLKAKQVKALFFKQDGTSIKNYEEHEGEKNSGKASLKLAVSGLSFHQHQWYAYLPP
ncbi:Hypothetical predicted protein [Mytilus galloprovincialis]|uniref:DNA 3'-5' helicase n=1 Tax=Mytilus galloprovincialis TaxID=29158 RepID=A0A8B6DX73_MYTGA|nr:Hypothetical predicted protein [Mytilus galloprovincialis]